jgi:hypothetical protein
MQELNLNLRLIKKCFFVLEFLHSLPSSISKRSNVNHYCIIPHYCIVYVPSLGKIGQNRFKKIKYFSVDVFLGRKNLTDFLQE